MIQSSYTPVKPKNYQADALTKPNKRYLDSENHRGFRQNRINYRGKALKQAQNRLMAQKAIEMQKQINQSAKAVEKQPIGMTAPVNPPNVGFIGKTLGKTLQSFGISRQGKGLIAYASLYGFFFLSQF